MEDTLDTLLRRLGSRRKETAWRASEELIAAGPEAIEPLVRLLTHGDGDMRHRAGLVLSMMNDARVLGYMVPLLRDEDAAVAGDALRLVRTLGGPNAEGTDVAHKILTQPELTGSERLHLLRLLEQIAGREWKTKLRYPLGSLYLFCRQQARSTNEARRDGAKAVLDALTLPRASQPGTSREMLRAARHPHAEPANILLRPRKAE